MASQETNRNFEISMAESETHREAIKASLEKEHPEWSGATVEAFVSMQVLSNAYAGATALQEADNILMRSQLNFDN